MTMQFASRNTGLASREENRSYFEA